MCKMSVGGEERRFVWGRGPGHWSDVRSLAAPRMLLSLPEEGHDCRPKARPSCLCCSFAPGHHRVQASGTEVPGATLLLRVLAKQGTPQVSTCFSTGGRGAPMSWRPCLVTWASWSWGLWSASPGALLWTSLRTWRVGAAISAEDFHEAWAPGLPGHSCWPKPVACLLCTGC